MVGPISPSDPSANSVQSKYSFHNQVHHSKQSTSPYVSSRKARPKYSFSFRLKRDATKSSSSEAKSLGYKERHTVMIKSKDRSTGPSYFNAINQSDITTTSMTYTGTNRNCNSTMLLSSLTKLLSSLTMLLSSLTFFQPGLRDRGSQIQKVNEEEQSPELA